MEGLLTTIISKFFDYGPIGISWSVVCFLLWVMYKDRSQGETKPEVIVTLYKGFTEEYKDLVKQNSEIIHRNTMAIDRLSTLVDERTRSLERHNG